MIRPPEEEPRLRALGALDVAGEGLGGPPEKLENARLYALIGIGQAILSVQDVLVDILHRLEERKR